VGCTKRKQKGRGTILQRNGDRREDRSNKTNSKQKEGRTKKYQ